MDGTQVYYLACTFKFTWENVDGGKGRVKENETSSLGIINIDYAILCTPLDRIPVPAVVGKSLYTDLYTTKECCSDIKRP